MEQKALRRSSSCSTQPGLAEDRKGFNGGPTCAATLVGGLSLFCYYDAITPLFFIRLGATFSSQLLTVFKIMLDFLSNLQMSKSFLASRKPMKNTQGTGEGGRT